MRYRARRGGYDGPSHDKNEPLYSTLDALNCLDYFGRTATYAQVIEVAAGAHATFIVRATWAAPVASCCAAPRSRHTPKTS
jgi:hypothetical protein